jgi:hypothetical protein
VDVRAMTVIMPWAAPDWQGVRLVSGRALHQRPGDDHFAIAMTDPEGNEFDIN